MWKRGSSRGESCKSGGPVNATGTTWLGTTMECAQRHSHKYDPFSQEEYFEMFAFFNNTPLEAENKSGKEFP